jgi:predicted nucleic acid-binding protein
MIILDTNVLSELIKSNPAPKVADWFASLGHTEAKTTSVSLAEMMAGARAVPDGRRRNALTALILDLFETQFASDTLAFDAQAAKTYGDVVAGRTRAGNPIGTMDAQIASIALSLGASVATRDTGDFAIEGLTTINPWQA